MIDFDILERYGSTKERLREVATAKIPSTTKEKGKFTEEELAKMEKDVYWRARIQERIQSRIQEAISFSMNNHKLYSAVDLSWDSSPINKETIPLIMYAQGKVSVTQCANTLSSLGIADEYVKKGEDGEILGIDLPEFYTVHINLIKSIITRRLAAQAVKYNNLFPFYDYQARTTSPTGKIRGDVLSQRMEIMVDQFDYRHHDTQVIRDMFMYAHSLDFVRSNWEVTKQIKKTPTILGDLSPGSDEFSVEEEIVKEGLAWVNPHPTRVFWDNGYPLASINSDTGCEYLGFWDVKRYRDINNNPAYFNKDDIEFSSAQWGIYAKFTDFFNQYLDYVTPPNESKYNRDIAGENDRLANVGQYGGSTSTTPNKYGQEDYDEAIFVTEYYEKIIPKEHGIGDYPHYVWVRHTVASDDTIIYSEFLPSAPAAYCGFNENDSRQVNASFAHEVMPYQDQMTNLMTQLLKEIRSGLLKVITVDTDVLGVAGNEDSSNEVIQKLRKTLEGREYSTNPIVVEYSGSRAAELGFNGKQVVTINETKTASKVTEIFQAMSQVMNILDRMAAISPAEQGQPAPREISATEVVEIANTTSAVFNFVSESIDEFRAAKKRICYESHVAMSKSEVKVPISNRYTDEVIRTAGFAVLPEEQESTASFQTGGKRATVIGSTDKLIHDYVFTTRDGSERAVNTQAANTLVQMLNVMFSDPTGMVLQGVGKKKLYEIFNEIFRMSGAGLDLKLQVEDGEDESFGESEMAEFQEMVGQLGEIVKGNSQSIMEIQQAIPEMAQNVEQKSQESSKAIQENVNKSAKQIREDVGNTTDQIRDEIKTTLDNLQKRLLEDSNPQS